MLRGNLRTTPLPELLQSLAGAAATGCVYLQPDDQQFDAEEAAITLRDGAICGVTLPSTRDALGTRLVATRQLTPADLAEARLAQETELATWMLADLLIHLGLADEATVQTLSAEQALSDLTHICAWDSGSWRFRRRARLGRNLPVPLPVDEALATVGLRLEQWRLLLPTILGADAVVSLASEVAAPGDAPGDAVEMDSEAFVLLCTVDGTRTIAELAIASGFTLLEAGHLTAQLAGAGLVQLSRDMSVPPLPGDVIHVPADELDCAELDDEQPAAPAADISFDDDGPLLPENIRFGFSPTGAEWEPPAWQQTDRLADALARVSAALSEAMVGPADALELQEPSVDALAVEFVEPVPLETLSELVHDDLEDEAEREAFLETVDQPYDNAFLESVEAVTEHEPPVEELVVEEPEVEEPEVDEPLADETVVDEPAAKSGGRMPNAAEASRMLSQLAGEVYSDVELDEPSAESESESESEPEEQHAAPAGSAPTPRRQTGPADTAALLRELSSLGAENGGGSGGGSNRPSAPRQAPSQAPSAAAQKGKRKGLFGRS